MFHAVFLITIGLIFLGNNFGVVPWSTWQNLIPYWPVLIIFAGVDALLGKSGFGHFLAGIINSIIFLAIVARVVGFNFKPLRLIPLPKEQLPVELYFTNKNRVNQGFYNLNGRKGTF